MKRVLLLLAMVLSFASCGSGAGKENAAALAEIRSGNYANEGGEYTLTGYVGVPRNLLIMDERIKINLYNAAGQDGNENYVAELRILFGKGPNSYYVPEKFHASDVEIYDKDGHRHGYLTPVTVTGTLRYTKKDWREFVETELVKGRFDNNFAFDKRLERQAEAKADAEKREKATGDPNDYSFELIVTSITVK